MDAVDKKDDFLVMVKCGNHEDKEEKDSEFSYILVVKEEHSDDDVPIIKEDHFEGVPILNDWSDEEDSCERKHSSTFQFISCGEEDSDSSDNEVNQHLDIEVASERPVISKSEHQVGTPTSLRLTGRHFPRYIPPTTKQKPTRQCAVCCKVRDSNGKRIRRETRYYCPDCKVGLCVDPCFRTYHTVENLDNNAICKGRRPERKKSRWQIENKKRNKENSKLSKGFYNKMAVDKQKRKGNWTEEAMKNAIKEVISDKMTIRQASEAFAVPKSTLGDRLKDIRLGKAVDLTPQMGRYKKTFDEEMERQLVMYLQDFGNMFMPLNRKEFLKLAFDMAEHLKVSHQFNKMDRTAGKQFYYDFMKRHPEVSMRSEPTNIQRAEGFNTC